MGVDAVVTLVVLVAVVGLLARELIAPVTAVLGGVVILLLVGVIGPGQAFAGFSNSATVTVAALLIVAQAVQDTGVVERLLAVVMPGGGSDRRALGRILPPVAASSSLIANTPVVAMLAPPLRSWAERNGRSPSRFLMPLSFAAILGGVVTTIGTSVTLLVSGLVEEAGEGALGILEITPVGLPVALMGIATLVATAPRLLPDRSSAHEQVARQERDYTFTMVVVSDGPLDGITVRGAGLRNLAGVYLVRIERGQREVAPVAPEEVLLGGDELTFVGDVEVVRDLRAQDGLVSVAHAQVALLDPGSEHALMEVVVGPQSPLVGRTPKGTSFRGRYGAAILAIHRAGAPVEAKLGEIELEPGDALLLLADRSFAERWRDRHDFLLVAPLDPPEPPGGNRMWFVLGVLVAMVVLAATGLVSLLAASLGAALLLVASGTLSVERARESLDLDVLMLIAGAIGLGGAVQASGLAGVVAAGIADAGEAVGPVGALAAVLIGTLVLTEMVTNAAAAALMVPIALEVAGLTGSDPHAFAVTVAVGASASFLTPIGYQTNTMVYGLGGYRFGDYWRLGLPLTLTVVATTLVVVPLAWRL